MQLPTNDAYAIWVAAEQLRAYMQQTVKHIPCDLPSLVTCYFDGSMNLVAYAAVIRSDGSKPLVVGLITLFDCEKHIAYTREGMVAQAEYIRANLLAQYGVLIHKTYAVKQEARYDYAL